ncbi:MFS general substrate transporter [Rostrohypoxylon terebratum]|nr:MFS general substrate transporter [Rostrohypoxylon terebratum]
MELNENSSSSPSNQHHNKSSQNTILEPPSRNTKPLSIKVHQPNQVESNHETGCQLSSRPADVSTNTNPNNKKRNPSSVTNTQSRAGDQITSAADHHNRRSQPLTTDGTQENSDNQNPQQVLDPESNDSSQSPRHVGVSVAKWKLGGLFIANLLLCFTYGYDIGNAANIQPFIYKSIGSIVYLPWFGIVYSASGVCVLPLSLMILKYRGDTRILPAVSRILMIVGSALSGSATNPVFMTLGRAILNTYIVLCAPRWLGLVNGWMATSFACGLIVGPNIGNAFSNNEKATWRWAFFMMIPLCAVSVGLQSILLPNLRKTNERLFRVLHTEKFDLYGLALHILTCSVFAVACYFLGAAGDMGASIGITLWVAFTFLMIIYVIQQTYGIGTTANDRVLSPFSLMRNQTILKTWICTFCAAVAYGAALYSVPISMAFNQGLGPRTPGAEFVRFLGTFVGSALLCGLMVQAYEYYKVFFILGSICFIAGGASFQLLEAGTPESSVRNFEGLIAIGLGSFWQLAIQVCMTFVLDLKDRLHLTLLNSIAQFGGVAAAFSISEMIYQSIGFQSLKESLGNSDAGPSFSDKEILQLLAGVSTPVLESKISAVIQPMVMGAFAKAIKGVYVITIAAGALSLGVAASMKWEAISFEAS